MFRPNLKVNTKVKQKFVFVYLQTKNFCDFNDKIKQIKTKIADFFSKESNLSKEELEAIIDEINIKTFKKGMILLNEGDVSTNYYSIDFY